jgi:hypothetical protein
MRGLTGIKLSGSRNKYGLVRVRVFKIIVNTIRLTISLLKNKGGMGFYQYFSISKKK